MSNHDENLVSSGSLVGFACLLGSAGVGGATRASPETRLHLGLSSSQVENGPKPDYKAEISSSPDNKPETDSSRALT